MQKPASFRNVTFLVDLESSAADIPAVYLTGSSPELGNWEPSAIPLKKLSDSLWFVTLSLPEGEQVRYKVTAGAWIHEALNAGGQFYPDLVLRPESDTTLHVRVYGWLTRIVNGRPLFTRALFPPDRADLGLYGLWRYHPGDDTSWADPSLPDSSWALAGPLMRWLDRGEPPWDGRGWFRFHMVVDSSLWNTTLGFRIRQVGASEVYYNGRLLYAFGDVGSSRSVYTPNAMSWWQQIRIDPQRDQLIAVRYADPEWRRTRAMGFPPGFTIILSDLNAAFSTAAAVRERATVQMTFVIIPFVLFLLHLALYGFMPPQRHHLYYALCMLGFAGLTYFGYERELQMDVAKVILYQKLNGLSAAVAIFFGNLSIYALNYDRFPRRSWLFVGMFVLIAALILLEVGVRVTVALNYVLFGMSALEGIYATFKGKKSLRGSWIILVGFLILTVCIALQMLLDYSVIPPFLGTTQMYILGMMTLAISMSIFLSYNFGRINRDLEIQLAAVKQLSERTIEQERAAYRAEMERRMIEAENDRKSQELESARELQLSLLPRDLPVVPGLEIAALTRTATEVGGDYYDFFADPNGAGPNGANPNGANPRGAGPTGARPGGRLTVAVGDATGHGLKAGHMVMTAKGVFSVLAAQESATGPAIPVDRILSEANSAIKRMNLHMLTMGLAVMRFDGSAVTYGLAGMPPILLYRAGKGRCEVLLQKTMPLGAVADFTYRTDSTESHPGDVFVLASDGLMEMFDAERETYGLEKVQSSLVCHAGKSAQQIAQGLFDDARRWAGDTPLADDLTVVVIKNSTMEAK